MDCRLRLRTSAWIEIALVFVVFFIQGAWPVPDVNEPHYLGKTIHFWNPDWVGDDFFLDSADTHKVFYFTFGWLSLWLGPVALAWVGRLLTWALLAWSWRRLSFAVLPRRWWSILTAALMVTLIENCHMAGEWIIGGVEAKGFAFVFVFLGLEALVRNRWNRAWLFFGAAAMFHVLVGGWATVAAGFAWLSQDTGRPKLRTMLPGLVGGLLLAMPSLVPSLKLTWGVDPETVDQACRIYVFERLPHHLAPGTLRTDFVLRQAFLVFIWLVLCLMTPATAGFCSAGRRLRGFVTGAIAIAAVGLIVGLVTADNRALSARLLRLYWFRLADVAVLMGVALCGTSLIVGGRGEGRGTRGEGRGARGQDCSSLAPGLSPLAPRPCFRWLVIVFLLTGFHLGNLALKRPLPRPPRADVWRVRNYADWRRACRWIARPENIPPGTRFLTPRLAQTFKWYTGHSEVVTWKDIPQDARSIVRWWTRMQDIHATGRQLGQRGPNRRWRRSLSELGSRRLNQLGRKYNADYVLTLSEPPLPLDIVYENDTYAVYRLR